jgi:hypothetical protein
MICLQELASVTSAHIKDKAHYESALSDVRDQARVRGVEAEDLRHQLATAKENMEAALRRVASVEQVLFNPARLATVVMGTWCHSCHVLGTRGCAHAVCTCGAKSVTSTKCKSSYKARP